MRFILTLAVLAIVPFIQGCVAAAIARTMFKLATR